MAGNAADNTTEIHLSSSNISHLGVEWSAALGRNVTSTSEPVAGQHGLRRRRPQRQHRHART
jgi:hypothetical protein